MDPHHHHHHHHQPCHVIHPTPTTTTTCCHPSTCHPPPQNPFTNLQNYPLTPPPSFYPQNATFKNYPFDPSTFQTYPFDPTVSVSVSALIRRIAALECRARSSNGTRGSLRDAAARMIQAHFRAFLVKRSRTLRQLKTLALVKSALRDLERSVSGKRGVDYRGVSRKAMELLLKIDSIQGGDSMIRDGKRSVSRDLDRFLQLLDGYSARRNKLSSIGLKNSKTRVSFNGQQIDTADCVISSRDERVSKERANGFYHGPYNHDDYAGTIELENFRVLKNGNFGYLPKRNGGLAKKHGGDIGKAKKNLTFAEKGDLSRVFVSTHEPNSSEEGSVDEDDDAEINELDNFRVLINGKIGSLTKRNGGLAKQHSGDQCKAKKNVAFAKNGDLSRVSVSTHEPNSSEDGSSDEEEKLLDNFQGLNNGKVGSLPKRNGGLANRHGGDLVKAKKNVTFAENGNLSRVFVNTREPNSSEDGSVDEKGELLDNLRKRVQKIAEFSKENGGDDQEAYSEDEESSQTSNGQEHSKRVSRDEGNYVGDDNDFVFSAPMPVKMESKADLMKTQKA